jgi:hypothetical protein
MYVKSVFDRGREENSDKDVKTLKTKDLEQKTRYEVGIAEENRVRVKRTKFFFFLRKIVGSKSSFFIRNNIHSLINENIYEC